MTATEQGWSEYWRSGSAGGEVFVSGGGRPHPALSDYWRGVFAPLRQGARIVDLACGAGSVFSHLPEAHGFELHAVDTAIAALELLRQRIPDVTTSAASAVDTAYDDGHFDLVVSQFGVEYGGRDAFTEAARLVARGGRLAMLCHIRDGYIDAGNDARLVAARHVVETGFIDKAIALTDACYTTDRELQRRTADAFVPAERVVAADVRKLNSGVHAHLYLGFRRLYERRRHYAPGDITNWLGQMRAEVERDIFRLATMREAALSPEDMASLAARLSAQGLQDVGYREFVMRPDERPVAWDLTATRP